MADLFEEKRREIVVDMEMSERRRRLYSNIKKGKSKKQSSTWSVRDHQDYISCGYSDKLLRFPILHRRFICSPAFWALTGIETKTLVMCCNETFWTKAQRKTANGRRYTVPPMPKPFTLPLARLEAVGISRRSAIRSLDMLQRLGFIDEIASEQGKPTVYCLSDAFMDIASAEIGSAKMTPPSRREKPVCGDAHIGKTCRIAI